MGVLYLFLIVFKNLLDRNSIVYTGKSGALFSKRLIPMESEYEQFDVDPSKEEVIYSDYVETLLDDDALDPFEAGFLEGYTS